MITDSLSRLSIKPALFEIDGLPGPYKGYHIPEIRWNGFAVPYFKLEVVKEIIKDCNLQFEPHEYLHLMHDGSKWGVLIINLEDINPETGEFDVEVEEEIRAGALHITPEKRWPAFKDGPVISLGGYRWTWMVAEQWTWEDEERGYPSPSS